MMVFRKIAIFFLVVWTASCKEDDHCCDPDPPVPLEIKAVDASLVPQLRASGVVMRNANGQAEDPLVTLQNAGVNTIRIRLWNHPASSASGFEEVKTLAAEVKAKGMKVWLCLHYSDTWADPGHQTKPAAWESLGFEALQDSVYAFTKMVVTAIQPDFIQIGNEINAGLLWPEGSISNLSQMKTLLGKGIQAVRDHGPDTRIMIHHAGHQDAKGFFEQLDGLDYDLIALSYYPYWHGKNLIALEGNLTQLSGRFGKKIVIAETAYPFTLSWSDNTHNLIGLEDQLHPDYPASPEGQKNFLLKLRELLSENPNGAGLCYWAPEWVAYRGSTATDGSSWENQALWDFDFKALPALQIFKD